MTGMFLHGHFDPGLEDLHLAICRRCGQPVVFANYRHARCPSGHRDLAEVRDGETVTFDCVGCRRAITVERFDPDTFGGRNVVYCGRCRR